MKVHYGIVCDDVRREDNGKLIAIGIYGHSIIVAQLPANLSLTLLLSVDGEGLSKAEIELRVRINEEVLNAGKGEINLASQKKNLVTMPNILLKNIRTEGMLEFQIKPAGSKSWITVAAMPLTARKTSST